MNPPIDRTDGALRAWLELGPDRGRPEAIERALAATRRVPQRPGWSFPERWLPVNRALLAAAAALIVVVGGAVLILRPSANVGPPPSPTPTVAPAATSRPVSTPSASGRTFQPPELLHTWVGAPHPIPGQPTVDFLSFGFQSGQLSVNINFEGDAFTSAASVVGANTLELRALSNGCDFGLVGHYIWSLSPGGTLLHLEAIDDACAARSAALAGDWHSANCKDQTDVCWGDLEAGTYPTLFYGPRLDPSSQSHPLYGGLTFTVPEGWAVAGDHTSDVRILRSSDYANEGPNGPIGQPTGIEAWVRPAANYSGTCEISPWTRIGRSPQALTDWIHGLAGLTASRVSDVTIDGHPGKSIDVSVSPSQTLTCGGVPYVSLITDAAGIDGPTGVNLYLVGISGQSRIRLIFLDIGPGDSGSGSQTAMILVTAPDKATFDSFITEAMPIVDNFHFK